MRFPWIRPAERSNIFTEQEKIPEPRIVLPRMALEFRENGKEKIFSIFQLQEYLLATGRGDLLPNVETYDPLRVEPELYKDLRAIPSWEPDHKRQQTFAAMLRGLIRSGTKKAFEPYITPAQFSDLFGIDASHEDPFLQELHSVLASMRVGMDIEDIAQRLERERYLPLLHRCMTRETEEEKRECQTELRSWQRVRDNLYLRLAHPTATSAILFKKRGDLSSPLPRRAA